MKRLYYKLERILFSIIGFNVLEKKWAEDCTKQILCEVEDTDVVISAISSNDCASLYMGKELSSAIGAKWIIYAVDAIPAPLGWSKNNLYYRSLRKFIREQTSTAAAFFSANPVMLTYQKTCLSDHLKGTTGVVYTPFTLKEYDYPDVNKAPVFVYTGSLYGLRHIDTLLEAFSLFLKDYPKAKIIFVGSFGKAIFKDYEHLKNNNNLQILSYTKELESIYSESTVLLDLSADIPNDVFLSSKIVNYLPLHRPIVAIGGDGSAASVLFKDDKSIIVSSYRVEDILCALKKSVLPEFIPQEGRIQYLETLSDEAVSERFYKDIEQIVKS